MTTILIVEDEALIADDIQSTLARFGYDVPTPVATAAEAIEAAEKLRPALVLIDIKLRGKRDGIEAGAEIRARFGLPIVYLTSQSDEATVARAKLTSPHGYLLKPFHERELRIAIDVALHKHQVEMQLAVRERWFATTLGSIGDPVIATDQNEIITFTNAAAERLTGWGREAIGRPLAEVFKIHDMTGQPVGTPIRAAVQEAFAVERAADRTLVIRTGAQIVIDENAAPILDENGALLGGVIVFRDITERRRLEQRVAQSERLASIGTMAAGMAHEINNPLAYVKGNLEVTLEGLVHAEADARGLAAATDDATKGARLIRSLSDAIEAMRDAAEGAERVNRIVRNLRMMGTMENASHRVVDLPDVLDVALKMTAHATRHHAEVRRAFGITPFVFAGESELGQVFTNLIINATQAIGDGNADRNKIEVATYTDANGWAVVEVRDSGPGIRPEVLSRLFDPFFTTKTIGAGMGLGLSICHNIVTAIGGTITASNSPNGGACFTVTLPPAKTMPAPATADPATKGLARRGKVLIVDDEPAVASVMARGLRGQHDVTMENDGRNVLARIAAGERFDIIFCDLMMPSFSGQDVYQALSASNSEQAARMVFVTGGVFSKRTAAFLDSVANARIEKPFVFETLRSIVQDYLKG